MRVSIDMTGIQTYGDHPIGSQPGMREETAVSVYVYMKGRWHSRI